MTTQTVDAKTARATWDARLLEYRLARVLYDADAAFGPFDRANRAFEEERERLIREHGSYDRAKSTPDGAVRADRAWQRITAAETTNRDRLLQPMWKAARALARTPTPDFDALKTKMEVIDVEELWNDAKMDEDCFEIIETDVMRLRTAA